MVFQSDFGVSDGAVCSMYGVAHSVDDSLNIFNLTHDIPPFHIWEASYRLFQTTAYWPVGTVFVSIVDPGVGSERRSLAVRTIDEKVIITPDNGTLTHLKQFTGIAEARIINESTNRLPDSGESYTFHGRDIFAYTGARLASGSLAFEEVGPSAEPHTVCSLEMSPPFLSSNCVCGIIDILDIRYGNLWTNIHRSFLNELDIYYGDTLEVKIEKGSKLCYSRQMSFGRSFADSRVGEPLIYVNSLDHIGVAINQESFADSYQIDTGCSWKISLKKVQEKR
nr:S-adenosyl-l-methionine hydroxide adenosyltransferase family protein [Metabacillus lacus]